MNLWEKDRNTRKCTEMKRQRLGWGGNKERGTRERDQNWTLDTTGETQKPSWTPWIGFTPSAQVHLLPPSPLLQSSYSAVLSIHKELHPSCGGEWLTVFTEWVKACLRKSLQAQSHLASKADCEEKNKELERKEPFFYGSLLHLFTKHICFFLNESS